MSAARLCAARLFSKHGVIRVGGGEAGHPAGFDSRRAVSAGPRGFAVNLRSGAVDVSLLLSAFSVILPADESGVSRSYSGPTVP
jgi:hypothetical protein